MYSDNRGVEVLKYGYKPSQENCGKIKKGYANIYKHLGEKFEWQKLTDREIADKVNNPKSYKCIMKYDEKYGKNRNPYKEYKAYENIRKYLRP